MVATLSNSAQFSEVDMVMLDVAERASGLSKRTAELLAGADRAPDPIADRETAERVAAFVAKQLLPHERAVEARRLEEKGRFDEIASAVHGYFKPQVDQLRAAKAALNARLLAFDQAERRKADDARRLAEDAARTAREDAERLAAAAQTEADLDRAIDREAAAEQIQQQAATIAAPAQIRSASFGAMASTRKTVAYEIEDDAKLPRDLLMVNDAAIRARIAGRPAKDQLPAPIPGIKWAWKESMVSR